MRIDATSAPQRLPQRLLGSRSGSRSGYSAAAAARRLRRLCCRADAVVSSPTTLRITRYANLFSSAFTALGLLVTLEIVDVLAYFERNPSILPHMFIMAVCSAVGQLFIFHTIKRFGPRRVIEPPSPAPRRGASL